MTHRPPAAAAAPSPPRAIAAASRASARPRLTTGPHNTPRYGHADTQPPFVGWNEGLDPYEPVIKGDKLCALSARSRLPACGCGLADCSAHGARAAQTGAAEPTTGTGAGLGGARRRRRGRHCARACARACACVYVRACAHA